MRTIATASGKSLTKIGGVSAVLFALWVRPIAAAQTPAERITVEDRVTIIVAGQPALSRQYIVDGEGAITLPTVGRFEVAGLTAGELDTQLSARLSAFFQQPDVRVAVSRPQRVFIFGDVASPGTYERTHGLTLLELLVKAQYSGASEVLLVRSGNTRHPVLPEQADAGQVRRVNLRNLETALAAGDLTANFELEPGDTVYVSPRDPNLVHVAGAVTNPRSLAVPDGTTVLQLLTLAGWATKEGSPQRTRLVRIDADGARIERRANLDEPVRPGDTLVVPERYFNPTFAIDATGHQTTVPLGGGANLRVARVPGIANTFRWGRVLILRPGVALTNVGVDRNVFNAPKGDDRRSDFTVAVAPLIGIGVDAGRVRVNADGVLGLEYYKRYKSERSVNPSYGAAVEIRVAPAIMLSGGTGLTSTRERYNFELDARVRREIRETSAAAAVGPFGRLRVTLSALERDITLPTASTLETVDLRATLTQRTRSATAAASVAVSQSFTFDTSLTTATHRFALMPVKDAEAAEMRVGGSFAAGSLVTGRAYVSLLRYRPLAARVPPFNGLGGAVSLSRTFGERTQIGVRGVRDMGTAFQADVEFLIENRYGGWVRRGLTRRLDVAVDVERVLHDHYGVGAEPLATQRQFVDASAARWTRYLTQLGVLVGNSRVALQAQFERRDGARGYDNLRWGLVYDLFQAGTQ